MTTTQPVLEQRLLAALDAIDELPEFRSSGYFDTLQDVVESGTPFARDGAVVADKVIGGSWVGGTYDLRAIRLGDGYMSTWRLRAATPEPG